MEHEKLELADVYKLRHGQARRPVPFVDVSSDDKCRSKAAKLVDDFRFPNVAGVNDHVRAPQCTDGLGTEQPVCVRNDADKDLAPGHGLHLGFIPTLSCPIPTLSCPAQAGHPVISVGRVDLDGPISERIIRVTGGYWVARLKRAMTARGLRRRGKGG